MAKYQLGDHPYFSKTEGLIDPLVRTPLGGGRYKDEPREITVDDDHVPSITWKPLDEPARRAMAKRMEQHETAMRRNAEKARAHNPEAVLEEVLAMKESNERLHTALLERGENGRRK